VSNRLKKIKKLIELAEMELDKAAQTFSYMQNKLSDAQSQFDSLKEYQQEYAKQPAQAGQISPIQLQTHNAFAEKLSQAVVAQQNQVEESEKMLELAQGNWTESRARVKALEALYKRIDSNELAKLNKQEQRMLDELSTQKYSQSKHGFE